MNLFSNTNNINWKHIMTRIALVLISVIVIVSFLPRTENKFFHYTEGQPWRYGQLIAQFDFPIFKTDEAIKQERDSVTRMFQPYFNYQEQVGEAQVKRFLSNYKDGIPGMPKEYVKMVADRLNELYDVGIIGATQYNSLTRDTSQTIRVVYGKEAESTSIDSVYSTIGAYEHLFMDEHLGPMRAKLQVCNLNEYIEPNLSYDKERSEMELNDNLSMITQASGMVLKGQSIITMGDIVNEKTMRVLNSYEEAMAKQNATQEQIRSTFVGQTIYVLLLVTLFTIYLTLFRKDYFEKPRAITMLYVLIVLFPVLTSLMMEHPLFSVYIIPFAMAAIFVRMFMDSRTAFIAHATMTLICAVAVKYQYEFIIVQLVAGLIAIYSLKELSKRSQIFLTAILVTLGTAVVYCALQLIQADDFSKLDKAMYYHFAMNGFFLLFTYPLMLIIEKMFGFTSTVTLFELSNTNNPLLRKLSEEAPGTFQHSIMVGNLGAEIANRIGAKAHLVRTGALYHDIGKMVNPVFFTENQAGINPHDTLSDLQSASIIINHVNEGLKLAEENNLPRVISDFIATHHGMGVTKYFYISYKNKHPNEDIAPTLFRYPGPNPFTREQAILMMCDAVEAASRSLDEYTEETISRLVNQLIDAQVGDGFFNDCPITFRDIQTSKKILIERLKSIYHTRIQYPQLKAPAKPAE